MCVFLFSYNPTVSQTSSGMSAAWKFSFCLFSDSNTILEDTQINEEDH